MASLSKVYVAHFVAKGRAFATEKVVAKNYDHASDLAKDWGEKKYGARVKEIRIEKGKGEVIADV